MRIIILGSEGSIGKVHQRNLRILGETDITCIDKTLGTDLTHVENLNQYDLVIIATPTDTHYELLHACNQRCANYIMVEKPLFSLPTPPQIAERIGLNPTFRELTAHVYVNNAYRHEAGMKALKDKLYLVGKKRQVMMENSYAFDKLHKYPYENYEGIIYDDVHIINSSRFIFGDPNKILYKHISKELAQFAWEIEDGTIITHSTDIVGQRYKKRIEVKGDEGTLIYNFRAHQLWFEPKDESDRVGLPYKFCDHLFESLKYVLETVKNQEEFAINNIWDASVDLDIIKELLA